MKSKVFPIILIVLLLIIAGGYLYLNSVRTRAIPDYNATLDLQNLKEEVTVYRDTFAIPHIYAKNQEDLYRAVGYVMAQDRLWQMDLLRRLTQGRLSEILGDVTINADQLFRSLRFDEKSQVMLDSCSPELVACLEAFADGVNQYIDNNPKNLPFEFTLLGYKPEHWTPAHSLNMVGYMSWGLTMAWSTEVAIYRIGQVVDSSLMQELVPDMSYSRSCIVPGFMSEQKDLAFESTLNEVDQLIRSLGLEVFLGSNNWVVAGKKSSTGMPILANDMHLELMSPGVWYQMHQVIDGELNVTGVVLPGQPMVVCGHNEDIAWGMTNVMLDDMDFYVETINPADSNQYLLDGEWKNMEVREEVINVKGAKEPEIRYNRFTHRGPVVSSFRGVKDHVISMKWIGNSYSNEVRSVYLFDRAANWDEFRDAAKTFIAVSQNIAYADREGNIGLQISGGVPIRKGGGVMIRPGETSEYDWTGLVPFEELPFIYNPECGYVASANNRTIGDQYPYYISSWYDLPNRFERIVERLTEKEQLSVEDFQSIQADQVSMLARKFTPLFLEYLKGAGLDETETKALAILEGWDYNMAASLAAPLIFDETYIELIRSVFGDETGEDMLSLLYGQDILPGLVLDKIRITRSSGWLDNVKTPDIEEGLKEDVTTAFKNAVADIIAVAGNDPATWKWGDYHTLTLMHPLGSVGMVSRLFHVNKGPIAVGGSFHTVSPYSYEMNQGYGSNHGASHRHIFSTADWNSSRTIIPTGESGIPASPYYLDQTEWYVKNIYHADYFTRDEVEKHAVFTSVLK
ncbi:MAG: penicillin acylase family protein [Bacteroidota bacterium]